MNVIDTAIIGGGCFWCVEGVYRQFHGIIDVIPGYAGGHKESPTYEEVCTGNTGHAEVVKVIYETAKFSYKDILELFFIAHDPTTLNRQGNDIGTQYRSIILYQNDQELQIAKEVIQEFEEEKVFLDPVVTQVEVLKDFYAAEEMHHNYFAQNQDNPYCQAVISPKVAKIRSKHKYRDIIIK